MTDYDQVFERALGLMESGSELETAMALWDHLLQELATNSERFDGELGLLHLNKALCLVELGRLAEAIDTAWGPVVNDQVDPGDEVCLRLLLLVMEQSRQCGDLGRSRVAGERALEVLENENPVCSPDTLVKIAQERAALAREMGQPDEAENMLQIALEILTDELEADSLESETRDELAWAKARLFETRAHNRFEGHADEIAQLDLEDAVEIYLSLLGPDHEETRRVQELLTQVSGNY